MTFQTARLRFTVALIPGPSTAPISNCSAGFGERICPTSTRSARNCWCASHTISTHGPAATPASRISARVTTAKPSIGTTIVCVALFSASSASTTATRSA
ncbi:hypothetical protein [Phytohabitans aurantiacus]|uniref:hypothetical protein n=1 Tax=Phytohabitans aurantiacus TaxID=3016789 RepID=UPI0024917142|nr:hypothetical protein [Phytohabitans aurantiacus]